MSDTIFTVLRKDGTYIAENATPAKSGDKVTITFPCFPGYLDFTPQDDDGNDRLFDVVENNGMLGVMYPGRDRDGVWHDLLFIPFKNFSPSVIFTIIE